MKKSRIQIERERKKADFLSDYKRLMSEPNAVQLRVFERLAEIYGYSDFNTARTTYFKWKEKGTTKS